MRNYYLEFTLSVIWVMVTATIALLDTKMLTHPLFNFFFGSSIINIIYFIYKGVKK